MSTNPSLLRRRVLSISSSSVRPCSFNPGNSTPSLARAFAVASSGVLPGRNWAIRHALPAAPIKPRCRAGRSPQLTSEDLPLPELPKTTRKRVLASLSTIVSISFSRPKKRYSSSSLNGRSPGKGFDKPTAKAPMALSTWIYALHERAHFGGRKALQAIDQLWSPHFDEELLVRSNRFCHVGMVGEKGFKAPRPLHFPDLVLLMQLPRFIPGAVE